MNHAEDQEYRDLRISAVEDEERGWSVTFDDGWSFYIAREGARFAPKVGMTARLYGHGIGSPVRGLAVDGATFYYRTQAEDDDHRANATYGATVDDLLAKWDAGESIWTIERGGLGPGYEQCIQIMAVEFARAGRKMPRTVDASISQDERDKIDYEAFGALCDAALKPIDEQLGGVSGAQYGEAKWLAWQWCFGGGPRKLIERAKGQGLDPILCSRHFPQAPVAA